MEILETIGFDLGHGETAVAKARVESIEPPEMLEVNNKKVQVTALGWHPELGYLVGEQALIQAGVTQLKISFKQKPNNDPNYRETIRSFVETYYRLLKESKQIEGGENSQFYVGCPSGWSVSDREEYQKLLKESGIGLLSVVPESRAAFMQAKEAGKLDFDKLKSSVLIVDIGSSTTDFTLVKSLHEIPIDFGSNALGASLIDKAIFARTLAKHEEKALLERVFGQFPHHQARCELACRKAKEDYFSNEQLYKHPQTFARGFESNSCLTSSLNALARISHRPTRDKPSAMHRSGSGSGRTCVSGSGKISWQISRVKFMRDAPPVISTTFGTIPCWSSCSFASVTASRKD